MKKIIALTSVLVIVVSILMICTRKEEKTSPTDEVTLRLQEAGLDGGFATVEGSLEN